MDVFEFDKCLLQRLQEAQDVLCWKDEGISSARVKYEWKYFVEIQVEPTGWQALWKIPRIICEEMKIRYPTVVFGMVESVIFNDLKAIFCVQAVQDDDVHLPEKQEVNLIDLFPTKVQENKELNVERTAEVIDSLRFFYQNIWMPWDNDIDEDFDWAEKHLESRMRFCNDLKKKNIKRSLATHIKTLLAEAKYIQERREYIVVGLDADEPNLEDTISNSEKAELMKIHLRLSMIKSEMDILENPETRLLYEESKSEIESSGEKAKVFIVTSPHSMDKQLIFLEKVKSMLSNSSIKVQMCNSFQKAIELSDSMDEIFLPPGTHFIKFLDLLNDNGTVTGIGSPDEVIIKSPDDESILLIFEGNFKMKNVTLDCSNVRNGIVLKKGNVLLDSCILVGDGKSSTQLGILCNGSTKLLLKNSVLKKFSTGIELKGPSELMMKHSQIQKCNVGIEPNDECKVAFENVTIEKCSEFGISWESKFVTKSESKILMNEMDKLYSLLRSKLEWSGNCNFKDCALGNIVMSCKSNISPSSFEKNTSCEDSFHSFIEIHETSEEHIEDCGHEDNNFETDTSKSQNNNLNDCSVYVLEDSIIEN